MWRELEEELDPISRPLYLMSRMAARRLGQTSTNEQSRGQLQGPRGGLLHQGSRAQL